MEMAQCAKAGKPLGGTLTHTMLCHSSAKVLFDIYRSLPNRFPDLMPDQIQSVELPEGEWDPKHSKRRWILVDDEGGTWVVTVEDINNRVMSITWALEEGIKLHKLYRMLKVVHQFSNLGNGCKATVTLTYVKIDARNPAPHGLMKFLIRMLEAADRVATTEQ